MQNLVQLVCDALPDDVSSEELLACGAGKSVNSYEYLLYALRLCPRLNWQAYLAHYPEAESVAVDAPCHFLSHGIYEGHQLFSWHPAKQATTQAQRPKVSIVISNFNHAGSVGKCLESLTSQTLRDIEIIFVDDASTDHSLSVANQLAANDARIKILALKNNQSVHMTRIHGAMAATGDYLMFMDSDDFYTRHACETAYKRIIQGYDIVVFNVKFINHSSLTTEEVKKWQNDYNKLPPGLYQQDEVLNLAYQDELLTSMLWSKIYLRELVQATFKEIKHGYYNLYEDMYDFPMILSKCRTLYKDASFIFNYSFGNGITTSDKFIDHVADKPAQHAAILTPLKEYWLRNGGTRHLDYMKRFLFRSTLKWVKYLDATTTTSFFRELCLQYGTLFSSFMLMHEYYWLQDDLAAKMADFFPTRSSSPQKVGLMTLGRMDGETIFWLTQVAHLLQANGFECVIFTQDPVNQDYDPDLRCATRHILWHGHSPLDAREQLESLHTAVVQSGIELMLVVGTRNAMLLWDAVLLKLLGIGVIGIDLRSITHEFSAYGKPSRTSAFLHVLGCLDKVICFDRISETSLRLNGIDAIMCDLLPPRQQKMAKIQSASTTSILVFDLTNDDPEKIDQCLALMREVQRLKADASLTLVKTMDIWERDKLIGNINEPILKGAVRIEPPFPNLFRYLQDAAVILATATTADLASALSRLSGLPLIKVSACGQGASLYDIACIVVDKMRAAPKDKGNPKAMINRADQTAASLPDIIQQYAQLTPLRKVSLQEYQAIIDTMAMCADYSPPAIIAD